MVGHHSNFGAAGTVKEPDYLAVNLGGNAVEAVAEANWFVIPSGHPPAPNPQAEHQPSRWRQHEALMQIKENFCERRHRMRGGGV